MTAGVLLIDPAQHAALRAAAGAAYPEECCGLLVGRRQAPDAAGTPLWRLTGLVPTANQAAEPRRGFEIDPAAHIALLRRLRGQAGGEAVIGHYHSHPDAAARPSARDRAQANDPALIWLIVAVAQGQADEITAWQPAGEAGRNDAEFAPIELIFTEDGTPHAEKA